MSPNSTDSYFIQTARYMQKNMKLPKSIDSLLTALLNREHIYVYYDCEVAYEGIADWDNEKRILIEKTRSKMRRFIDSNLLEDEHVVVGAPEGFPVSVTKREVYPTSEKTKRNAEKQGASSPSEERDAIKILSGRKIQNVNSVEDSLVKRLAGHCTVLVRYYYISKDRIG